MTVQGTRPYILQAKTLHAATKTQCSQIRKLKNKRGGAKMAEEQDGENTFSPTNSSKEHLNTE